MRKALLFLVVLVALLLSVNSLSNPFILDDSAKIVGNNDIRNLDELAGKLVYPYQANQILERNDPSRPLVFLLYGLTYSFAKLNPATYRAWNIVFHALCGVLVFLIAARIIRLRAPGENSLVPFVAAMFFVVLPINMGSVIYVYALSDVLSSALILLSFYLYIRADWPRSGTFLLGLASMVLALLAKQSALVLPALVMAFDLIFRRGERGRLKYYVSYALVGLVYLCARKLYFGQIGDLEGVGNTHPTFPYLAIQPVILWRYLFMTFIPQGLAIDHAVTPSTYSFGTKALALAALVYGLLWLRSLRSSEKTLLRMILFGASFYLISLAPTSSVLPTVDVMVERRVYLGNLGIAIIVGELYGFFRRSRVVLVLAALHLCVLAGVSLKRNNIFHTEASTWQNVLESYPKSIRAKNNLALVYMGAGQHERAKALFEELIRDDPRDYHAFTNLGALYSEEGPYYDPEKALAHLVAAVEIKPDFVSALYNLGWVNQKLGRENEAEPYYAKVIEYQPSHVLAMNNLGVIYWHRRQIERAREYFEKALELDPGCIQAKGNLVDLAREHEVDPESLPAEKLVLIYEEFLAKAPDNLAARKTYARICLDRGLPCARSQYETLARLVPEDEEVRQALVKLGEEHP
ncbi:MAG: tetratricopeptide repeat protein [Chloroflexi bacterium]|nr:tetratricopeptide repeat protein [Chloroflexota bacterium]